MHYNFTAFDEFEIFSSKQEVEQYREFKINEVQKNISFVKNHFDKKIDVLEIGSGNSKFLYGLEEIGLLNSGYGIDISKSRIDFANEWKSDLQIKNVYNIQGNVLELDMDGLPKFDLIYCVDMAFQLFDPANQGSDIKFLNSCYKKLKKGGKIVLELDNNKQILKSLHNDNIKLWQEFDNADPWMYLLWDCNYDRQKSYLHIKKAFIKRDLSKISRNNICLRIYTHSDIISILDKLSFNNIQIYNYWNKEGDMSDDEFLVIGEK